MVFLTADATNNRETRRAADQCFLKDVSVSSVLGQIARAERQFSALAWFLSIGIPGYSPRERRPKVQFLATLVWLQHKEPPAALARTSADSAEEFNCPTTLKNA